MKGIIITPSGESKTQNRPQIIYFDCSKGECSSLLPPSSISNRLTNLHFSQFVFEKSLHDENIYKVQKLLNFKIFGYITIFHSNLKLNFSTEPHILSYYILNSIISVIFSISQQNQFSLSYSYLSNVMWYHIGFRAVSSYNTIKQLRVLSNVYLRLTRNGI